MSSSGIVKQDPKEKVEGDLSALPVSAVQALRRSPPAVLSSTPNPMGLVLALRRRWWLAAGLAILGSALTASGMWFLQKATFTARTTLLVYAAPLHILSNVAENRNFSNYQRTQAALVKSRRVIIKALQEPNIANLVIVREQVDPITWLESQIRADFAVAPEIMRISINGEDPNELILLVNAVRKAYLSEIVGMEKRDREARVAMLHKTKAKLSEALKQTKSQLEILEKEFGPGNTEALTSYHELAVKELNFTVTEWQNSKFDLMRAQVEASMLPTKEGPATIFRVSNDILEDYLSKEPDLAALSQKVSDLKNSVLHIERNEVDPNKKSGYLEMKSALQATEKDLKELREKRRPEVETKILEKLASEGRSLLPGTKQNIDLLDKIEKSWKGMFDSRSAGLDRLKVGIINVEKLKEEMAQDEQNSKKITSYLGALEIEYGAIEHGEQERIKLLDETSYVPDLDGRIKKCAMGGAGVFALILFGVALLEFRQRRVNNVDEVVRGLDMCLMGTLPAIPQRSGLRSSGQSRAAYWQNILTESVDSARTMLLHMAKLESRKVVMITSAVGGEGKTLLSCHLAISLARAGLRTLLVDCDLRSAAVHKVFGLRGEPGFSNLLTGEVEVSAAVQEGPIAGLWVLPAGQSNSATFQALAQHKAKDVFKQLKDEFDFVLVDSAPLLPVADSLLVASCVDAVILSILRDVSRLPTVYAAYERLAALRVHFLGAVVNGASGDYYHSRYPYPGAASAGPHAD